MILRSGQLFAAAVCGFFLLSAVSAQETAPQARARRAAVQRKDNSKARAESLRSLAERLEVRPGATVADIGAGKGRDTWVFAEIVGKQGRVYAVEIDQNDVKDIGSEAESRDLKQVRPVLGKSESPGLPDNSVDLAFMHYVYHHLAKPREMLRGIWKALKPGGYYVVVDRHKGTLVDWVPRTIREKKHFWVAETTFVREAREEGFRFVGFGEEEWYAKNDTFVLIMQRPTEDGQSGQDPDPLPPIDASLTSALLAASPKSCERVAFVALGEGRKLIKPIVQKCQAEGIDMVLEEWATQKDERPEIPDGVKLRSVLTEKGDPKLPAQQLDAVYFLDTYHLLFHGDVLLPALRKLLKDDGRVFVLDAVAAEEIPHREASHRRKIAPQTVKEEMSAFGFQLESSTTASSPDRFLLVFRKHP
jgi:predicted methyltransferase